MILFVLTLLTSLVLGATAAYFSVVGFIALFSASPIGITVLATTLEISKLVMVSWLHHYWDDSPKKVKYYLVSAIAMLMLITSIGVYGYLSKAHLESGIQVPVLEEQMKRNTQQKNTFEKDIISLNEKITTGQNGSKAVLESANKPNKLELEQLEAQVTIQKDIIVRSQDNMNRLDRTVQAYEQKNQASSATAERNRQKAERTSNQKAIKDAEAKIVEIQTKKIEVQKKISETEAKIQSGELALDENNLFMKQKRETESSIQQIQDKIKKIDEENLNIQRDLNNTTAKLGPLKYLSDIISSGDNEKAVKIMIAMIMFVFDPAAIALLIAAQWTFVHFRTLKKQYSNQDLEQKIKEIVAEKQNEIDKFKNIIEEKELNINELNKNNLSIEEEKNKIAELYETDKLHLVDKENALAQAEVEILSLKNKFEEDQESYKSNIDEYEEKIEEYKNSLQDSEAKIEKYKITLVEAENKNKELTEREELITEELKNYIEELEQELKNTKLKNTDPDINYIINKLENDKNLTKGFKDILEKSETEPPVLPPRLKGWLDK